MRLTFLGTGSTSAAPVFGCNCKVCILARADTTWRRLPASAMVESDDARVYLDAGLANLADILTLAPAEAILLTRIRPERALGLFHLRWGNGDPIRAYCPDQHDECADLRSNPGMIEFKAVRGFESFDIGQLSVVPLPAGASAEAGVGYCIENAQGRLAYLVDCAQLAEEAVAYLRKWCPSTLVLDCANAPAQRSRQAALARAAAIVGKIRPGHAWLTRIGHDLDDVLRRYGAALPLDVSVAHDGEVIEDV